MTQLSPEKFKQFMEQATKSGMDAWSVQTDYFDQILKRNSKALTSLAGARLDSFRGMGEARTFNQAFEANLAFEESVREELGQLHKDNLKAWEAYQESLKAIFLPVTEAASAAVPKNPAAGKAAPKKAAPKKKVAKKATLKKAASRKAPPKKRAEKPRQAA